MDNDLKMSDVADKLTDAQIDEYNQSIIKK